MNTSLLLLAEYGTAEVRLDTIAPTLLGMTPRHAADLASRHALPFPVHRAAGQKSPWLVSVLDLAQHIDRQREAAARAWQSVHTPA